MQKCVKLLASFFYLGLLSLMPGTYGSIAGVCIYLLVRQSLFIYLFAIILFQIIGFLVCGKAEIIFQQKDSKKIVIDEVSAMLICYFLVQINIVNLLLGFVLFRIFDIFKPFPINQIQELPGSLGIMLDDLLAAIYTNITLHFFMLIKLI